MYIQVNKLSLEKWTCLQLWMAGFLFMSFTLLPAKELSNPQWLAELDHFEALAQKNRVYDDSALNVCKNWYITLLKDKENKEGYKYFIDTCISRNKTLIQGDKWTYSSRKLDSIIAWTDTSQLSRTHKLKFYWLCTHSGRNHYKLRNSFSAIKHYELAWASLKAAFGKVCGTQPIGECLVSNPKYIRIFNELWWYVLRPLIDLHIKTGYYFGAEKFLPSDDILDKLYKGSHNSLLADIYLYKTQVALYLLPRDTLSLKDTQAIYGVYRPAMNLQHFQPSDEFQIKLNLINISRKFKQYEQSAKYIEEVRSLIPELKETIQTSQLSKVHLFQGYLFRDRGLFEIGISDLDRQELYKRALQSFQKSQSLAEDNQMEKDEMIYIYFALAKGYFLTQNYENAEVYFQKTFQFSQSNKNEDTSTVSFIKLTQPTPFTILALEGLADCWFAQYQSTENIKDLEKAAKVHQLIQMAEDSLKSSYLLEEARLQINYNSRRYLNKAMRIAYALWQKAKSEESIALALSIIGRSRARALQSSLTTAEISHDLGIPENLIKGIHFARWSWQTLEHEIDSLRREETPNQAQIANAEKQAARYKDSLFVLTDRLATNYPAYYQVKFPQATASLSYIQRKLPSQEAMVAYFWGENALYALVVGKHQYDFRRIELDEGFREGLEFVNGFVQNPSPTTIQCHRFNQNASQLYQQLLGDLESFHINSLIILPDKQLSYLPFEVLLTKFDRESSCTHFSRFPYLWKKYRTRYAYLPNLMFQGAKNSVQTPRYFYIGFAPSYSKEKESDARNDLSSLEFNIPEVRKVHEICAKKNLSAKKFEAFLAREDAFRTFAPQSKILHIAMHNYYASKNQAQLVFNFSSIDEETEEENDGRLFLYEIYSLKLYAELVVLNACETGIGVQKVGEGFLSMGRAFRMTGCKNLMMSLWNVDDQSSSFISAKFFEYLIKGYGKAEALTKAKEAYLNSKVFNNLKAPYYWAHFVLNGDSRPVSFNSKTENIQAFLFFTLSIILLGIFGWKFLKKS